MALFIILGAVVSITFVVLGVLFFLLGQEEQKKDKVPWPTQDAQTPLIETLTKENEALKSQIESINAKMRLLEEEISRAHAAEPDQDLHQELENLKYELIKARAQSRGLERVSFNYKNQLEDFLRKSK